MKENYQKNLTAIIESLDLQQPPKRLLLHSCCAPCSSYVLEYLSQYFSITVLYYNPNIYPSVEYDRRVQEQQELIAKIPSRFPITFLAGRYEHQDFLRAVKGLEGLPEGGERCFSCYQLRLVEAAKVAREHQADYFTTTLSISPLKNAEQLNRIGAAVGREYGVVHLPADFKKRGGYQRSLELSREFGLYRQDYCGCEFSLR